MARCLPITVGLAFGATIAAAQWIPQSVGAISVAAFLGLISTSALIWNAVPDNIDPIDVGTAAGWVNAVANFGSILSPILIGQIIQDSRERVLVFVSIACLAAAPFFVLAYVLSRRKECGAT